MNVSLSHSNFLNFNYSSYIIICLNFDYLILLRANSDSQCLPFHYHLKLCHSHSTVVIKFQIQWCANIDTVLHIFAYQASHDTLPHACLAVLWQITGYIFFCVCVSELTLWNKLYVQFQIAFSIHAIFELNNDHKQIQKNTGTLRN